MFCSKCGQVINANDRFCPNCGATVEARNTREFSPMFKIEAENRSKQILKAQADFHKDIDGVPEQKPVRESIKWNWDLSGFPTNATKKTEPVNFNWATGTNTKRREPSAMVEFERIEPKKDMLFTDRAAVEKATAELEIGKLQAKARGLSEEYNKRAEEPKKEILTGGFSDIMNFAKSMEEEKPLTIDELEKSIFEEIGPKEAAKVKEPTEAERVAIDEYFDRTIIAKHFDLPGEEKPTEPKAKFEEPSFDIPSFDLPVEAKPAEPESTELEELVESAPAGDNRDARFYTYNQKIDAFDELLNRAKSGIIEPNGETKPEPKAEPEIQPEPEAEPEPASTYSAKDDLLLTELEEMESSEEDEYSRSQSILDRLFGAPTRKEEKSEPDSGFTAQFKEDEPEVKQEVSRATSKLESVAAAAIYNEVAAQAQVASEEESKEEAQKTFGEITQEAVKDGEQEEPYVSSGFTAELNQIAEDVNDARKKTYVDLDALFGSNAIEQEEKPKRHIVGKILVILLIILLVGEAGLAAFKIIAPESKISLWTDDMIVKIIDKFTGGGSLEEEKPAIDEADAQAAYLAGMLSIASADAATVGEFTYNSELKYANIANPAYKEVAGAGNFVDADWYQDENGQPVTYSSKLFEVFVKYYDNWQSTNKDKTIVGINKIEVGEIRSTAEGFYILSKITFAKADGTTAEELKTTYIKMINDTHALVVNGNKKEEV